MATEQEQIDLWQDLWNKQTALVSARERLRLIPIDERPDAEGIILAIDDELEQVRNAMDDLDNNRPIPFPSPDTIAKLREAVGRLAVVVGFTNAVSDVIKEATKTLETWPLSNAG